MADIQPFVMPEWAALENTDNIHSRMLSVIPNDTDKSPASFPWDFTWLTAAEKAEFVQFSLMEAIKQAFPQWAEAFFLTIHAQNRNEPRKPAISAVVDVIVKGTAGINIPAGFVFSTLATVDTPSIQFATVAEATIDSAGQAEITCMAVAPGKAGNVAAGTITQMAVPMTGITSIKNTEPAIGGIDIEDIEALRRRIVEFDRSQNISFVGSTADYRRWAMEVPGVGNANPIGAVDGSGMVTIVLTNSDGLPAEQDLCDAVFAHIIRPDDPGARLSSINTNENNLLVIPAMTVEINISAAVLFDDSVTNLETIKAAFLESLRSYLLSATGQVIYTWVSSLLSNIKGVIDHTGLTINGGTANIAITANQIAVTNADKVVLSAT